VEETIYIEPIRNKTPKIVWCDTKGVIREIELAEEVTLGRVSSTSSPDIGLHSTIVSREHGKFMLLGDEYYYFDQHSGNGTWVDGLYLGAYSMKERKGAKLQDGSVIRLKVENIERKADEVVLVFTTGYAEGLGWESIVLSQDIIELQIGRNNDASIEIDDRSVSRKHATFFNTDKGWSVIDLGSKNGVYVNNVRIQEPVLLKPMDVIKIASRLFFYTGDKLLYQKEVELETEESQKVNPQTTREIEQKKESNKTKTIDNRVEDRRETLSIIINERNVWERFKKKTLLKDIKIDIKQNELVLILGGSGAGKTTFMNAVMGYEKADGKIIYGNTDIYSQYKKMKYDIGFVPQIDLLRGSDTVFDTLVNAAEMKLPTTVTEVERLKKVNDVLHLLGLEREKNSLVVKLSGGQRKRLSIAVEFISDPSLFFLDEPDSGLDGIMARSLMENLKYIAQTGKIVMVITHGPDRAAHLFDKVIVLAKSTKDNSGHLAFYGSIDESYSYFESDDLEGIVKKINRKDEGGEGLSDYFIDKFKGEWH